MQFSVFIYYRQYFNSTNLKMTNVIIIELNLEKKERVLFLLFLGVNRVGGLDCSKFVGAVCLVPTVHRTVVPPMSSLCAPSCP